MENLLAFLLLIGPLVFFHELGHLIAAKLVDVKAVRFSLGFGPPLVSKRLGETEYCIAPIPLGGYVQLLGQRPGEGSGGPDADRALANKPLWAKYFVYFAGPAANLLLPLVVYFFYFVVNVTMVTPPVVGTVLPGTAAAEAGLQQGDRIVAIDERDVRSWSEMAGRVAKSPEQELQVQIERDGKRLDRVITPKKVVRRNAMGTAKARGRLGVISLFYAPEIGIIDPQSPAYLEGLRTGDVITSINGEPVRTIEELERMLAVTGDGVVRLTYLRAQPHPGPGGTYLWYESAHAQLLPRKGGESPTGVLPARTFVRSVDPGSPADAAGMKAGDRILSVDGRALEQWVQIDDVFSVKREEPVRFELQSPGQTPRFVDITLGTRTWTDIYEYEHSSPWLGANQYGKAAQAPPEPLRGRFTYALSAAVDETVEVTSAIWTGLVRMLTFDLGIDQLSSVVGMYAVAGRAYEQGPGQFLFLTAMVSINLFIINLLPIPILDGGHILFFTIEAVRRRPLSQRAREIASAVGLVFILLLLLVATRNDILRYIL
ncbi:MAG: RIP metalloprotease RseP [Myxococcota bacterium]